MDLALFDKIIVILINAIGLWLAFWILLVNWKSKIHQMFFLKIISILLWVTFSYFTDFSKDFHLSLLFLKLNFGAVCLFFIFAYFFSIYFPKESKRYPILDKIIVFVWFLFFYLSIFTDLIFQNVEFKEWGTEVIFGKGISYFYLTVIISTLLILAQLFKKYFTLLRQDKLKIQYFLIGIFLFALFNLIFNVFFPIILGTTRYYQFGDYSAIFLFGFTAYAIVRYRFLNIKVTIGQVVAYILSFATIILAVLLLIFLNSQLKTPLPFFIIVPFIALLSILLFQLTQFYRKITAKYFYPTFYNTQIVIANLEERLTQVLELETLSALIINTLNNTLKLEKIGILIKKVGSEKFLPQNKINFSNKELLSLIEDNFCLQYLERTKKPILQEELILTIDKTKETERKEKLQKLQDQMQKIGANLILPLIFGRKLITIIILGSKISGEAFFTQDIELLTTLSLSAPIALKNASLFSEIKKRKEELERFYRLTIGRELKMVELRKRTEELEEKLREKNKEN